MSSEAMKRLKEIVHGEFQNFYKYSRRARTSDVVALVMSEHPDLVAELQTDLMIKAVTRMCSAAAKSWMSSSENVELQWCLPGIDPGVIDKLPPAISVPVEGNTSDIDFIPASVATKAEWIAHFEYLTGQHRAIGLKLGAVRDIIERGHDCPMDRSLFTWLAKMAKAPSA